MSRHSFYNLLKLTLLQLNDWYGKLLGQIYTTSVYALGLAGGVFIFIGLLNALQRMHRDRFATAYTLNRLLAGVFLVVYGVATLPMVYGDKAELYVRWMYV